MKRFFIFITLIMLGFLTLLPQSITVTSPTAGETWRIGHTYLIKWTDSGTNVPTVKIRLYDPTLTTKILNITNSTANATNGSYSWSLPNTISPGNYRIRVKTTNNVYSDDSDIFKIDNLATKFGLSINKNISKNVLTIQPRPDFEAYGKQLGYIGYETIKFQVAVKNMGNKDAGNVPIRVTITGPAGSSYSNYTFNSALPCPTLPQNMSCTWSKIFTIKESGLYRFKFTVNPTLAIKETRFSNNSVEDVIAARKPDLVVAFDANIRSIITTTATVKGYIKNIGHAKSAPCKLKIYMEKKGNKNFNVPALNPGQVFEVSRGEKYYIAQTITVKMTVDANGDVNEKNENNNFIQDSLKVVLSGPYWASKYVCSNGNSGYPLDSVW